jgi:hypothetical protein
LPVKMAHRVRDPFTHRSLSDKSFTAAGQRKPDDAEQARSVGVRTPLETITVWEKLSPIPPACEKPAPMIQSEATLRRFKTLFKCLVFIEGSKRSCL